MYIHMNHPNHPVVIPLDPRQRWEWIKYALRLAGYSLGDLARELGVARCTPAVVFEKPYPKMERAIAARLGLRPEQIWPERYGPDGKPNRRMGRPIVRRHAEKITTPGGQANGKGRPPGIQAEGDAEVEGGGPGDGQVR